MWPSSSKSNKTLSFKTDLFLHSKHFKYPQPATLMFFWHKWRSRSQKVSTKAFSLSSFDLLCPKALENLVFQSQSQRGKIPYPATATAARGWGERVILSGFLRHSRTTKFTRSKELGQVHEIAISIVLGIMLKSHLVYSFFLFLPARYWGSTWLTWETRETGQMRRCSLHEIHISILWYKCWLW